MRPIFHALLAIAVLWCGLHVQVAAAAHPASAMHAAACAGVDADCDSDREEPGAPTHVGHHHHCPVAPDQRAAADVGAPMFEAARLRARPTAPLASVAAAPLLKPPAA